MNGVLIKYGDIAVGAKEKMQPEANQQSNYSRIEQLKLSDVSFLNYGNPCEKYSVILDGSVMPLPSVSDEFYIGYISSDISGEDGKFEMPIILNFVADDFFTSSGITLTFDSDKNIYPRNVLIQWYREDELLDEKNYEVDNALFFFQNKVEFFNRIQINIYDLNMPLNRLCVKSIQFGHLVEFEGKELRNVSIIQETDVLSTELSFDTCDFIIESKNNIEYTFNAQQPIKIYFDDALKATTFVTDVKRIGARQWSIKSGDYVNILAKTAFWGGMYNNVFAVDLLKIIFDTAKVPYFIDDFFNEETITGYLPYTDCRTALQQVAFAIGAMIDTSESEVVNVIKAQEEITQTVTRDRIKIGQSFTEESRLTVLEIRGHSYVPSEETFEAYSANESGTGEQIFVTFYEPLHSLQISDGDILESGVNYAIINANENAKLTGKKYEHTTFSKRKYNPLILSTDTENIVRITNATLINGKNIDKILELCYNYYANNDIVDLKIIEGKHDVNFVLFGQSLYGKFKYGNTNQIISDKKTKVGDVIQCQTEYRGTLKGLITKQRYNLNGGIIVKETEMRLI